MRCPRCDGNLIRDGDQDLACLQCGWSGYPRPEAVALREQLLEEEGTRRRRLVSVRGIRLE